MATEAENPFISLFPQTNSLGVVTGQPLPVSSAGTPLPSEIETQLQTSVPLAFASDLPTPLTTTTHISTSGEPDGFAFSNPTAEESVSSISGLTLSIGSASLVAATSTSPTSFVSSPNSIATATSSAARSGLTSSAKVGIGLGIPLSLIILGIVSFVLFPNHKNRKNSRSGQDGNIAAVELDPDRENAQLATNIAGEGIDLKSGLHEMRGAQLTMTKKLPGSPGVRRHELPDRSY